jgi:hypothetical protein
MVCISYLEVAAAHSQLRYLMQRIRSRLPNASIVVGFWPADNPILRDEAQQMALGAQHYVASLRDAVTACLTTAQQADTIAALSVESQSG